MGIGEHTLTAQVRPRTDKPAAIRRAGRVPGGVYGKETEPVLVSLLALELKRVFHQAGGSSLVNLAIEGQGERTVLLREPQFDPRTGGLVHLDLYQVKLSDKIKAEVPLTFVGEAPAVKEFDGVLVTSKDKLEVECLPADLPHELAVDLAGLIKIDDSILVKDIPVPANVEVLDDAEEVVVIVAPKREEEVEVAPISEAEAVAGVEVEGEKPATADEGIQSSDEDQTKG